MTPPLAMVSDVQWTALSDYVAAHLALHFPRNHYKELRRGMEKAALEYGFEDVAACIGWLLAQPPTPDRLKVLARHLTIGETYFFRDLQALEVLSAEVLAPLVAARTADGTRYLRLWSAGCSTGEEAYTLAILLHRMVPDIARWKISIFATDINTQSLRKAEGATYGEWSFRSAPAWLKPGYFSRNAEGRYVVLPHIRDMVRFGFLNLADDPSTAQGMELRDLDVVFCRHVLMYFEASKALVAGAHLHASLVREGWLVTSGCEASPQLFPGFDAVTHQGAVLMRRRDARAEEGASGRPGLAVGQYVRPQSALAMALPSLPSSPLPAVPPATPFAPQARPARPRLPVLRPAAPVRGNGAMPAAMAPPVASASDGLATPSAPAAVQVRSLANQGRLDEALRFCDNLLRDNKLDAGSHYLRAIILQELGQREEAEDALSRALYVDPRHALAHFAKGQLALARQARDVALRHFRSARQLLAQRPPDEVVGESDGITAGALGQTLQTLLAQEEGALHGPR